VVRGGLTPKHVDVEELLAVLDFAPLDGPVVCADEIAPGRWRYHTPSTPFTLWRFEIDSPLKHRATGRELLLWTSGERHGECVFLTTDETIDLTGPSTVFRVEHYQTPPSNTST
jgi:mannose-6-phosphate isomerase class I